MKKLLIAILILTPLTASAVWYAPWTWNDSKSQSITLGAAPVNFTPNLHPLTDNKYYLGSTTPTTLRYKGISIATSTTGCATFSSLGELYSVGTVCGSGSGGGSGGTWSTTTSQTPGVLVNYPNNASDVVVVGSNSSTTAEFWFDPNTLRSFLTNASTTAITSANASTTILTVSGLTSALIQTGSDGVTAEYAGTSCTNQFVRSLSVLGIATCATVVAADVDLADLTATNGTLTFSGAYDGQVARTVGLNLANANSWTGLQQFVSASSTSFSALNNIRIGTTATTSIMGDLGTSTFSSFISAVAASTTATSTMSGINLPYGGCFAIAGVCITGGGGSGTVTSVAQSVPAGFSVSGSPVTTSGTLAITFSAPINSILVADLAGTGITSTSTHPLYVGAINASSTTNNNFFGANVGISSTSPFAQLSVNPIAGQTSNKFVVGSSTGTSFIVNNSGLVGVGTSSPAMSLTVQTPSLYGAPAIGSDDGSNFIYFHAAANNAIIWKSTGDLRFGVDTTRGSGFNEFGQFDLNGRFVIGGASTTPWAVLAVNPTAGLAANQFVIGSSSNTSFVVNNAGNVGIATTTPYARLSVVGEVVAANYTATTTATSTFTGGLSLGSYLKASILTAANCDVKALPSDGTLYCGIDSSGGAGAYPFAPNANGSYNTLTQATSGVPWFQNGLNASSTSHFDYASSTLFSNSGSVWFPTLTSAIVQTDAAGLLAEYAGTSCTNQFPRSLDALGIATCATVGAADVSLANLTATNGTLTFSGTYNGSTARTIGLNLANANSWTALQSFVSASSTSFSALDGIDIGRTATTSLRGELGTSTFSSFIAAVSASTTATSTMKGINLPYGGCFAINGVCLTTSSGGTVTSVATNNGLTGGTITTTGTLGLDITKLVSGSLITWNGSTLVATGTQQLTVGNLIATTTTATSTFYSMVSNVATTTFLANVGYPIASTTGSTLMNINWTSGNTQRIILGANTTIVVNSTSSTPIDGGRYILKVCQGAAGGFTGTFSNYGQLNWPLLTGTTTMLTTANSCTHIWMSWDATSQDYTVFGSTTSATI